MKSGLKHDNTILKVGRRKKGYSCAKDPAMGKCLTEWWQQKDNSDAIYMALFGMSALSMRKKLQLPRNATVRNYLGVLELQHVLAVENTISLHLEALRITEPEKQLLLIKKLARDYKAMNASLSVRVSTRQARLCDPGSGQPSPLRR